MTENEEYSDLRKNLIGPLRKALPIEKHKIIFYLLCIVLHDVKDDPLVDRPH